MTADPRALVYNLLVGSPWIASANPTGQNGIGTGISITADDGVTVLSPSIAVPLIGGTGTTSILDMDRNLILVKLHPYAQEAAGYRPQVIVGPAKQVSSKNLLVGSKPLYQIIQRVEVRVLVRDWDGKDLAFTLNGRNTRDKILESIRSVMRTNYADPDGTGTFSLILISDPGQDSDVTTEGAIPLYRTAMQLDVQWFES
ncbi:MAG: hypothetical protein ACYCQJ_15275 [Nitrososphaerales archaeon]